MFVTDSIDVDVGTTSCGSFDDEACYVTCSHRHVEQTSDCLVTMNVTCDLDNVMGRYVRLRQNNATGLVLCDVNIMGWTDRNKTSVNFALNAPCNQSSTWHNDWSAGKAVDGNRNGTRAGLSCSHTMDGNYEKVHWWQVNLRKLVLVSYIVIANRVDSCCTHRLANFTVELGRLESNGNISYTLCRYHGGVAGPLTTLNCTKSIWGQFVRISQEDELLTLCEVEVYGDTHGNNTGHFTAKVSTENPRVSSEPEVSTENARVSSEPKVSTENPQVSSEPKVSTVYPEALTEAKQFTERKSLEEVQEEMSQKTKALTVKSSDLGQQVRQKSSVPDPRLSSAVIGLACAIGLSSILGAMILSDICHLCHYLWTKKGTKGKEKKELPSLLFELHSKMSCDIFDDKACYITCSSRALVQSTEYYVTTNVTCDVDNVKGRYVRVRQNTTAGLPVLCDVKVMGSPDIGKGVFLLFALLCRSQVSRPEYRLANFTVELGRLESNGSITYTLCRYHDGVAGTSDDPELHEVHLGNVTSKTLESTVNVKAKVSTMDSELTTTAKVFRMNSEITTKAKVSTTSPVTTTAKVSTMKSEITTQAQVSTNVSKVVTEAKLYTEHLQDSQSGTYLAITDICGTDSWIRLCEVMYSKFGTRPSAPDPPLKTPSAHQTLLFSILEGNEVPRIPLSVPVLRRLKSTMDGETGDKRGWDAEKTNATPRRALSAPSARASRSDRRETDRTPIA
ncbi:hypothetical protein C0Q70_10162 [Pomacea canaliculata]|uniref:Fucolectin tachylectin-4 pentraxin-1 domain-containing protein n=1 Tax=Pomacea canaliculata TaxID=400727 RepID=A0A2T7PBU2_POMCA|nr:hypothetical protein C0Q70_10162 [Pomacea canaliculata]